MIMKITFANEVENIRDGSYIAILRDAFEFAPENLCMKFAICGDPESTAFVKFISAKDLGGHSWRSGFKALDTIFCKERKSKKAWRWRAHHFL